MTKVQQFVSVVVYVYNNTNDIEHFIRTIMPQCDIFKQCELIFVDDCSTDDSVAKIKNYFKENPVNFIVSIIHMGYHHGMEVTMNAGRDIAIGDYVYEFDNLYVDFEGSVLMEAFNKCLEGNDIVFAHTDVPIKFTSKVFYRVFNSAMKSDSKIGQDTFRLLSRRGINRIISMDTDIPYRKVVYQNSGLSTAKIDYKSTKGKRPPRLTDNHERIDLAIDSFIYFTHIFQNISLGSAILFAVFFLGTVIYALVSRSMGYHIGMGWVSTIIVLAVAFTGLFGLIAVVIRYLSVVVDLVFKQQQYRISNIEKIRQSERRQE